jgi:serine/threonine-protein kinase
MMIGHVLDDRYELLRLLGQGGMGAVYEGRHTGTGRRVAVKLLPGEVLDPEHIARFQREARAFGALQTLHIAQVLDVGSDAVTGTPYLVLELLEGEDVYSLVRRLGPLPVGLALRIGVQACFGLERAHEAGIIHRDIKSANLFLARQEHGQRVVKLLDFGVAKVHDPKLAGGAITRDGQVMGTPLYMSPEQACSLASADARSDIWSLGVTLYECLAGRPPHQGLRSYGETMAAIVTKPTPPLREAAPWVPQEVALVIHRALARDRKDRHESAAAFAAALQALLPDGWTIDESMLVRREEAEAARPSNLPPLSSASPPPPRARVGLLVTGALAAAAAGGLAVYLAMSGDAPPVADAAHLPKPPATATEPASATATEPASATATATAPLEPTLEDPPPPAPPPIETGAAPTPRPRPRPPQRRPPADDETTRK